MIKGSINREGIIINIYEPDIGAANYIKEIQGQINSNKIIVGDFDTLLSTMDRLSR